MSQMQPIIPNGQPQIEVPNIVIPGLENIPAPQFGMENTPVMAPAQHMQQVPQMDTGAVQMDFNQAPIIPQSQMQPTIDPSSGIVAPINQAQYIQEQMIQQTPIQQELNVVPTVQEIPQAFDPSLTPVQEPLVEVPQMEIPTIPELAPVSNVKEFTVQDAMQNGLDLTGHSPEDNVKLEVASKEVTPISVGGLTSVGNCNVAGWGGFLKVLGSLTKDLGNDDVVTIENGILDTNKNGIFIHCDLQNVLGNISLNLVAPQATTKMLSTIRGGELVQIFKDDNNYHFCNILNGRILTRVKTRFAAESADGFAKPPQLQGTPYIKEIGANEQETIRTIIAGKAAMSSEEPYRFGFDRNNNTLVSIGVGSDFTYFFQEASDNVDEYKVFYPFPVSNIDSVIIKFFKFTSPVTGLEETWLHVVNNFDFVSVVCIEKIEKFNSAIEDFKF